MKYIEHLAGFATASLTAELTPNEGWLYMRLFWEANSRFWPEYIELSTSELSKLTGIKSHTTIEAVKKKLKAKGFIDYQVKKTKMGRLTAFKFLKLQDMPNNSVPISQNMADPYANKWQNLRQNMADHTPNNGVPTSLQASDTRASETSQDYKTIKTINKTIYTPPTQNDDLAQVFSLYQENITTAISPIQIEKLEDDVKTYGKAKVMYAILRAAEVGKNNLAYIEGILKNNSKEGEKKSNDKKRNVNTNSDPKRDEFNRKWIEQLRTAEKNQKFPWEQPGYNANEG